MNQAEFTTAFIDQIWNKKDFDKLEDFLHPDFTDHSLPLTMATGAEGTKGWIMATGRSFEHHTSIEALVTENENSIAKIRMELKHVGKWRNLEPTGIVINAVGYRQFKFKDGKIFAHWALIDGQAIENQITHASTGCKIAV